MAVCYFHQDRPGIGVCVRCRIVVCPECTTQHDGVNFCHACLRALGRQTVPIRAGAGGAIMGALLILALAWLALFGVGWLAEGLLCR